MSIDIRLKHSSVNGKVPQPTDLSDGELALNTNAADPAIYLKDSAGAVRRVDAGVVPAAVWDRTGTTLSPKTAGDKALSADVSFTQAGTGAVQRTVDSRLKDVISVKDFGAVGDGAADDTAAIDLAIAAVGSGGLYFPAGTYKVTSPLNGGLSIASARIVGDSRETSIIKYHGTSGTMIYLSTGSLENIQLLSNGSKSDGNNLSGIKIAGPSKVDRCTVSGFSGSGIILESQYASVIQSCRISNNTNGILGDGSDWSGVSVTSLTVQFNQFAYNTYGFFSDSTSSVWRLVIDNNLFDYCDHGFSIATHNAAVSNNWIEHSVISGGTVANTYVTLIGNHTVAAADKITVNNSGLPADTRGYININWYEHQVLARKLSLGNGADGAGADAIDLFNTGTEIKLLNPAYTAGSEPRLLTSPAQFKTSIVRYNHNRTGGAEYHDFNTGFLFTRHSAGKYLIDFNRPIVNFNWFVSGNITMTTTADGATYTTAVVCEAEAVAVNASTANWRNYSQATGMVVILRDNAGTLVDGQFCLQIIEPLADIHSY